MNALDQNNKDEEDGDRTEHAEANTQELEGNSAQELEGNSDETGIEFDLNSFFEEALEKQIGREEVAKIISKIPPSADPKDVFIEALEGYYQDHMARKMAMSEQIDKLFCQAAYATRIATTIGKMFGVVVDGAAVESSNDFVKHNQDYLRKVMTHCVSHADSLIREREAAKSELHIAQAKLNEALAKIEKLEAKSVEINSVVEAKSLDNANKITYINSLLAEYTEQPGYIVARIDPLTKKPNRFFSQDGEDLKTAKSVFKLLPITSLEKATSLRYEVVQLLLDKASKVDSMSVNDSVIIMQYSLVAVNLTPELD